MKQFVYAVPHDLKSLGLGLVKKAVKSYQGTIWVESGGPGQGSCFRFTLPGAARPDGSVTVKEQSLFAA